MSDRVKVSYYVSESVARGIRLLAAHEDRSQSDVAAEALESYLVERQESLDWMRAAEPSFDFWDNDVDAAYDAL